MSGSLRNSYSIVFFPMIIRLINHFLFCGLDSLPIITDNGLRDNMHLVTLQNSFFRREALLLIS